MNTDIIYEINLWPFSLGIYFVLESYLLGATKLTKNADFDKYKYSGYGIGFNARRRFSLSDGII